MIIVYIIFAIILTIIKYYSDTHLAYDIVYNYNI